MKPLLCNRSLSYERRARRELFLWIVLGVPALLALVWIFLADSFIKVPSVSADGNFWTSGFHVSGTAAVTQALAFFVLACVGTAIGFVIGEGMLHTALTDKRPGASGLQLLGVTTVLPLSVMMVVVYFMAMSQGLLIAPFLGASAVGVARIILAVFRRRLW